MEFKRKVADPLKIAREVVAFANTQGGYLLIGVDDDGSIPGLKYGTEEAYALREILDKHCPSVSYRVMQVKLTEKKQVVVFWVDESLQKPVFLWYNIKKRSGRAYIRVADKSLQTSREMRQILKGQHNQEGTLIAYGEEERTLLRMLTDRPRLDLSTLASLTNIPAERLSTILVRLTLANILQLHPTDSGDYFSVKD